MNIYFCHIIRLDSIIFSVWISKFTWCQISFLEYLELKLRVICVENIFAVIWKSDNQSLITRHIIWVRLLSLEYFLNLNLPIPKIAVFKWAWAFIRRRKSKITWAAWKKFCQSSSSGQRKFWWRGKMKLKKWILDLFIYFNILNKSKNVQQGSR